MKHRFLAYAAVYGGSACKNAFVEISGDRVTMAPFERETHSTAFVPGILYVTQGDLKEEDLCALKSEIKGAKSIDDALTAVLDFDSRGGLINECTSRVRYYIFPL